MANSCKLLKYNKNIVKLDYKLFKEKNYNDKKVFINPNSNTLYHRSSYPKLLSHSCINSDNEKEKSDNNIINIRSNYSHSSKINSVFKLNNEKKAVPSLFLKSDKILLNIQGNLTSRDSLKESLFKCQHNEKNNNNFDEEKEKVNKNFFKIKI